MPPAKARPHDLDARSDAPTKDKHSAASHTSHARGRRTGGPAHLTNGSHLKEVLSAAADATNSANRNGGQTAHTGSTGGVSFTPGSSHPAQVQLAHAPPVHRADFLGVRRPFPAPGLPFVAPPRSAVCLQKSLGPRDPRERHRQVLAHHGAQEERTTHIEGATGNSSAQKLQRSRCERV